MTVFLFGISMGEIVLIFLVVLMLFGSKNLPELARGLGKGLNSFRRATEEIKQELSEEVSHLREEAEEVLNDKEEGPILDDASVNALYGLDREEDASGADDTHPGGASSDSARDIPSTKN